LWGIIYTVPIMVKPENVLKNLFQGATGNALSREVILRKITVKTFNNYSPLLEKAGLVIVEKKDPNDKRKISKLRLTDKGKAVLATAEVSVSGSTNGRSLPSGGKLDLEEITRLTDEFTRRNPSWEWKLMRKEEAQTK